MHVSEDVCWAVDLLCTCTPRFTLLFSISEQAWLPALPHTTAAGDHCIALSGFALGARKVQEGTINDPKEASAA